MTKPRWRVGVDDIPDAGFALEVDSRDATLLALLGEVAEGRAGALAGCVSLQVEPWPKRVDIRGTLTGKVPLVCARCLEGYVEDVERTFNQILARNLAADDEEIELRHRDLDRSQLVGDTLDLQEIVREELMLSLPSKPLCRADCKGICPGCGAELNEAECTCAPVVDDRWSALAALKGRLGDK